MEFYNINLKWNSANQISISGIDSIRFFLSGNPSSNSFSAIRLKNVLFVFKLNINLLFLNKFRENEYEIHFESKLCQIKKNIIIINNTYQQNLTYFDFKPKTEKTFILTDSDFWHVRMRHINQKILSKLSKTVTNIKYSYKDSSTNHVCKICAKINLISKIKKFSNNQINIYLKNVFSNICDPINSTTFFKKVYFAIFVNQIIKWLKIRLLHTKNDVIQIIKNFIIFEKKQSDQFVKKFHTDNIKKFIVNTLKNYYAQKDINSIYSASYTSQQNDAAERINQTLINKVRIMLTQSKLPRKYWGEAVLIADYFYNKTFHSTINFTTSFEVKFGKIPDLNNIYVWKSSV